LGWALITFGLDFFLKTFFVVVNKKTINVEIKTKRMTVVNSLSFKVGIILLGIWLFVFIGFLEAFGAKGIYFCGIPPIYFYFCQPSIVDASKNIVRVRVESAYEGKSTIEIGARLGLRKRFSKCEDIPIILFIFIGVWGIAIILVLGAILYFIVIEPTIEKRKLRRNEKGQKQINQKALRSRSTRT
jgi:hypothetical protein